MKRDILLTLLFSGLLTLAVQAQDSMTGSGSTYSYLGIGIPVDFVSPPASAMGLYGTAVFNVAKPSLANPAFWGNTEYTNVTGGMALNYFDASDNFGSSENTNINFTYAHLVAPLIKNRLGFSLALYPKTESRYKMETINDVLLPGSSGMQENIYRLITTGRGGINKLEAGLGFRINDNISVGYAPALMFGVTNAHNDISFDTATQQPLSYNIRTRYRGFAHRIGVAMNAGSVLRNRDHVDFGVTVSLPATLHAHRRVTSEVLTSNRFGTVEMISEDELGRRDVNYPLEASAGISYYPSRFLMFGTELQYQQWSDYTDFDPTVETFTKDRIKIGLGFEYNAFMRGNTGLFNSLIYRLGVSYDTGHLEISGTDIETLLFSGGIGIPTGPGSTIEFGFDYGFRGTTSNNLVQERIFAIRASFNLTERMFMQRRLN